MKFTERAGFAMKRAQEVAISRGRTEMEPDDIVAGLAAEKNGIAARALAAVDATLTRVRQAMREIDQQENRSGSAGNGSWSSGELKFDPFSEQCLERAIKEAQKRGAQLAGTEHILLGVLGDPLNRAGRLFQQLNLNPDTLRKQVEALMSNSPKAIGAGAANTKHPTIDKFCTNLNDKAVAGKLDPLIGRTKELKNVEIILGRRTKRNPILIGEAGVGKTAIAEGLAQRIVAGEVKDSLLNVVVYQVDLGSMVAGTKYRGEFEERFKALLDEARAMSDKAREMNGDPAYPDPILVFDEVHTLVGGGSAEGSMDAANLLKPAIARGEIRCIGATTLNEFRKHIEPDRALLRRFQEVMVGEPSVAETIDILHGLKERYESFHSCKISDAAITAAAEMSARYIQDRLLPDKAIDLIDEAGSAMSGFLRRKDKDAEIDVMEIDVAEDSDWPVMTEFEIAEVVENHTGIAVSKLTETGKAKLLKMPEVLGSRVIGQTEAIKAVTAAMQTSGAGLKDPNRPIASLIFCGPTGVGKTELTKALAAYFFDDEEAMIRLDMSEYMEKHSVSKLVGSPPGYVGFNEGGQLTEAIRRKPYSVVLFDEIEKAHPDVFNIMLQVLDDGRLTDSQGRVVDFKNSIIIMTSNAGSKVIMDGGSSAAGLDLGGGVSKQQEVEDSYSKIKKLVTEELKQLFRPEFLNRVDKIVVFRPLEKEELRLIIDLLMVKFGSLLVKHNLTLELSEAAKEHILTEGYDKALGARPIRRAIESLINAELARLILADEFKPGDHLIADITKSGESTFSVRK